MASDAISQKQRDILEVIRKALMRDGQAPTVREIGKETGLRSSCSVQKHLNQLESKGFIKRDPYKYRSIELLQDGAPMTRRRTVTVPLVGQVAAGSPIDAIENILESYPLPETMIPRDCAVFMLKVKGDSMINAGIFEGDYVVVRKQDTAHNGDIVVARIGEEATVKTFYTAGENGVRLQPENPHLRPIITRDAVIEGKVIMSLRQYN
ncbi:MAG TPA: transcriptional repressor LexA [Armatimonadaceae bacterium]|jgi:repressor LexA|nr:transcriptional repressor LexA [Armatimonadaceae bacterium]